MYIRPYRETSLIRHNWECQFCGGLAGLADYRGLNTVHACYSFLETRADWGGGGGGGREVSLYVQYIG